MSHSSVTMSPEAMTRSLWRNRYLTGQLAWRAFTSRYKGSLLGLAWSVLYPLVMLSIYTLVFGVIFRSRWARMTGQGDPNIEFALAMFCGLVPFTFFSEVVNRSPTLVLGVPNYVKKVVFPLESLCVAEVLAGLAAAAVSLALLLAGCALLLGGLPWTVVYLPAAIVPLVFLTLGLSWTLAAVGVFLRDIGHTTVLVTQMLFFLTPIFYDRQRVPEAMAKLMSLNPLTTIVETFRGAILWGQAPPWGALGIVTAASAAVMCGGFAIFMKSRRAFSDVL